MSPLFLSQVGINTPSPDPSAALDIVAKASDKGLLIPRVPLQNITDITTVPNPAVSLLVYNTTSNAGITKGYYYWDGSKWLRFNDSSKIFTETQIQRFLLRILPEIYLLIIPPELFLCIMAAIGFRKCPERKSFL
jgi:hypothetical protein